MVYEKDQQCRALLRFEWVRITLLDFLISLDHTTALISLSSHDRVYELLYVINNANKSHRTPSSGYRLDCS